jgi:hypothetical protein
MIGDITYAVTVMAAAGTSTILTFADTSQIYYLSDHTPVGVRRRRDTTTAPDVAGALETASVADAVTLGLQIRVTGTSGSDLQTNIDALTGAFSTPSYHLAVAYDGVTHTYRARAADWQTPISELAFSHQREVILSVPVDPYPI